jgi:serine phosphatase RsbU (regulator of sigma subunit)
MVKPNLNGRFGKAQPFLIRGGKARQVSIMSDHPTTSKAFRHAVLRSESYRGTGLLFLLGAFLIFAIVRGAMTGETRLLIAQIVVLALVITHEALLLREVRAALDHDDQVAPETWVMNVVIETQIPTVALFLLLATKWMTPYQVLVAPAVLVYFLFIVLSTLRLSPSLAFTTGLLSAVGYLLTTFYVHMTFQNSQASVFAFPLAVYLVYAGLIFVAGVIAAVVAKQFRGYVAAALHEAELKSQLDRVTHDLDIARSIQQELIPDQPPQLNDFEIAGWNQPADQTGGDYFDWQVLPDGRVAISVADATGHGIGPALVSTSCRAYARASLISNGTQDHLLDRLNGLLAQDLSENRFVTFVALLLDPRRATVKVNSAGHGPILWYHRDTDKIENIDAQGIPLGMIPGTSYCPGPEIQMASGDMLVLITDGFYEWENAGGEQFGINRLESVIRECRDYKPEEIIARLRSRVVDFCGGTKQQDDLTAVLLRRK